MTKWDINKKDVDWFYTNIFSPVNPKFGITILSKIKSHLRYDDQLQKLLIIVNWSGIVHCRLATSSMRFRRKIKPDSYGSI